MSEVQRKSSEVKPQRPNQLAARSGGLPPVGKQRNERSADGDAIADSSYEYANKETSHHIYQRSPRVHFSLPFSPTSSHSRENLIRPYPITSKIGKFSPSSSRTVVDIAIASPRSSVVPSEDRQSAASEQDLPVILVCRSEIEFPGEFDRSSFGCDSTEDGPGQEFMAQGLTRTNVYDPKAVQVPNEDKCE